MKFFLIILSFLVFAACSSGEQSVQVEWKHSTLGGGGFITGLVQNPKNPDILYARCDVAGVFKSLDGAKTWKLANTNLTLGYHHNVRSIAIDPNNPDVLFRCSGELRGDTLKGAIHKSTDAGESWFEVSDKFGFFGNGEERFFGEVIGVNPSNSNVVVAVSITDGIARSQDGGNTWTNVGLIGERFSTLAFHPTDPDRVYAATHATQPIKWLAKKNPGGIQKGKVFMSTDGGQNWEVIFEKENFSVSEFRFPKNDLNIVYAATHRAGIWKSDNKGYDFYPINNGLPSPDVEVNGFDISPSNDSVLYAAPNRFPGRLGRHDHIPLVPLYRSTDAGASWQLISEYNFDNFSKYPNYIQDEQWLGWAIAEFMVDAANPEKLFISNWYGVSVSDDGGKNWSGNYFTGLEATCIENLVLDPSVKGKAYLTLPDLHPYVTVDGGKSYTQMVDTNLYYHNTTALVASMHDPDIILYGSKAHWNGYRSAIKKSINGGASFNIVLELQDSLTLQAIQEDPYVPGRFYAYIDRYIDKGAGLYVSTDWGESWEKLPLVLPDYIKTLPHRMIWIEDELLSVTKGQRKNVCGTNQLLSVDPNTPNTLYFGEWTEGLWKTEDAGESWLNVSKGLPFGKNHATALVDVKSAKGKKNEVYAGFIKEGLWRSLDGGQNWEKIYPRNNNELFNASSTAIIGDTIIIACEPLYYSPSPSQVVMSTDNGKSWNKIYNGEYGALQWKAIQFDPRTNTIYGGTSGNGAFYGRLIKY